MLYVSLTSNHRHALSHVIVVKIGSEKAREKLDGVCQSVQGNTDSAATTAVKAEGV